MIVPSHPDKHTGRTSDRKERAAMRTVRQLYRVDRHRISLIRFVFEAYDGLAVVTTLDAAAGIIAVRVAPGCEALAEAVLMDLGRNFMIEPVATAADISQEKTI
jgi:hypothetical protein